MAQSLFIKLVMLGVVFGGIALWGWPGQEMNSPHRQQTDLLHLQSQGIQILPVLAKKKPESRNALPQTSESAKYPLVDLNQGTLDELVSLPGIGQVLGQRIIEYRQIQGPFTSVEELKNVSGIGDKRMARLKSLVTTSVNKQNAS